MRDRLIRCIDGRRPETAALVSLALVLLVPITRAYSQELLISQDGTIPLASSYRSAADGAPVLSNPIPDTTAFVDFYFEFTFAENTFTIPDGENNEELKYNATRDDGRKLPGWLHFDRETRTFSGTPGKKEKGLLAIRVTASVKGIDESASDEFDIVVEEAPSNDPPQFTSTPVTRATEDVEYLYTVTAADPDGDLLSISGSFPQWLALNDDGVGSAELRGTPALSDVGAHGVALTVTDGLETDTQTFTIDVAQANDPPAFVSNPITIGLKGVAYTYEVLATDPDIGDVLTLSAPVLPNWLEFTDGGGGSGVLTGTPQAEDVGYNPVLLRVEDVSGESDVQDFIIAVEASSGAPTALGDDYQVEEGASLVARKGGDPPGVLDNDTDPDGDTLVATTVTAAAHGVLTLTSDGSFTYSHDGSETTSDMFGYIANDGTFVSNLATVRIDVIPVNDPPHFTSVPTLTAAVDSFYLFSAAAADPDGPSLTLEARSIPGWLDFVDHGGGSATLSGVPGASDLGAHDVVLVVTDGLELAELMFTVVVETGNSRPTARDDEYTLLEGGTLVGTAGGHPQGVLDNDQDGDGDPLIAVLVGTVSHGQLALLENGSFTYVHDGTEGTEDYFSYKAVDERSESTTAVVRLSIVPVNDPPVAVDDDFIIAEDTESRFSVLANDLDAESGPQLQVHSVGRPASGEARIDGDSAIVYTPKLDFTGDDVFGYSVIDPGGLRSDTAHVHVTVVGVNDAPRLVDDFVTTGKAAPVIIPVLDNDVDPDGDPLFIQSVGTPAYGMVSGGEEGVLTYVPTSDFEGEDQFTYVAADTVGATAEARVTVSVIALSFAVEPVGISDSGSRLFAINDDGWVTGSSRGPGGEPHAFLEGGGSLVLLESGDAEASLAFDINAAGHVVGVVSSEQSVRATRWTIASNKVETFVLPDLDGEMSIAYGVNDTGDAVGLSRDSNGRFHPVFWSNGGVVKVYGGSLDFGQAQSINNKGQIAGFVEQNHVEYGVRGTPGDVQTFGDAGTRGYAISTTGEVVGSEQVGSEVSAIKWLPDGTKVNLPTGGVAFAEAYGTNDSGWIVGTVSSASGKSERSYSLFTNDPLFETHGVLRSTMGETGGVAMSKSDATGLRAALWLGMSLLDLNDFIPPESGWILLEARDVNNAGRIVGSGLLDGEIRGFVLNLLGNSPPVSRDDHVVAKSSEPLRIMPLGNDMDPDGDGLSIIDVSVPSHGSVDYLDTETLEYVSNEGFTGRDLFFYTVTDGKGGSDRGEVMVSVEEVPVASALLQNYPNPFVSTTTLFYSLDRDVHVTITVYDVLGRAVATLVDDEQTRGRYRVVFSGPGLSAGVYFCRMQAGRFSATRRLVRMS